MLLKRALLPCVYFLFYCLILQCKFNFVDCQETQIAADTDIGTCTCDLTNVCDIGCCCDKSCTSSDRKTFSKCKDTYTSENPRGCIVKTLNISQNNYTLSDTVSGDLFCIFTDNYKSRNFYVVPALLKTSQAVTNNLASTQVDKFTLSSISWTPVDGYTTYYRSGSPIYVVYPIDLFGVLALPDGQGSCSSESPVQFLKERSTSCTRTITHINNCTTDAGWNVNRYISNFKIAKLPSVLASILNKQGTANNISMPVAYTDGNLLGITLKTVRSLDINNNLLTVNNSNLNPQYDGALGQCSQVLKTLKLIVIYSGTSGITAINAEVGLVTQTATTIAQSFSISFSQVSGSTEVPRSGNPGYLLEKPILSGRKVTVSGNLYIQLSTDTNNWLSVVSGGPCQLGSSRMPVQFGISTSSVCTVTIDRTVGNKCSYLDKLIVQALLGATPPNAIATFGNASPSKPGDWIPILMVNRDAAISNKIGAPNCTEVVTGAKLTVLSAVVGAENNPQNKIIGAKMEFFRNQISFSCLGMECLDPVTAATKTQTLPITMDVVFIDASMNATVVEKAKPVFLARLPYDFFYPFFVDSSPQISLSHCLHLICLSGAFVWLSSSQLVL